MEGKMEVIKISIDQLIPDPNNARKHSAKNLMAIKGSLTKFGQQKPIVISEKNIIVAGNGTVEAAKELGWKEISAVITSLDSFHQSAFALADNKTAELAEWDDEILEQTLAQLDLGGFDIHSVGFDGIDLPDSDKIEVTGSKELDESEFSEFDHKCPKCGFEFDAKD
jgi:ParB-like chromosome segregation protein Spo0J